MWVGYLICPSHLGHGSQRTRYAPINKHDEGKMEAVTLQRLAGFHPIRLHLGFGDYSLLSDCTLWTNMIVFLTDCLVFFGCWDWVKKASSVDDLWHSLQYALPCSVSLHITANTWKVSCYWRKVSVRFTRCVHGKLVNISSTCRWVNCFFFFPPWHA